MADVAPPTPPAPSTPGKVVGKLGRIPTPVKLIAAGGVLGLGYAVYRSRTTVTDATPVADAGGYSDASGVAGQDVGYASTPYSGVGVVDSGAAVADSGETVGAVGQTALETTVDALAGIVNTFVNRPPVDPELINAIGALAKPQPPPAATPQTPTPVLAKAKVPTGYTAGSTVYGKKFHGAVGWKRGASGKPGAKHYIHVTVAFSNGTKQDWTYYPNKRPVVWRKGLYT